MPPKLLLWLIIIISFLALIIGLPKDLNLELKIWGLEIKQKISPPEINLKIGTFGFKRDLEIKKGLDLQGGSHLLLEADMSEIEENDQDTALKAAREVIARRVDLYGITESLIQTSKVGKSHRIIVELPGVKNIKEAVSLIGQTAQLDFREPPERLAESTPSATQIFSYIKTGLTGKDLKRASVQFSPQTGEPVVALSFNSSGKEKFAEITKRNLNKPVAIFLDQIPITAPRVNEVITTGEAVITGNFKLEEAKNLAIQLNAGALPVPVKIREQKNIGATLGEESVSKSVRAGAFGLLLVALFMFFYYGRLGLIADLALIIFGLLTLALYKLIPVTLTLPGITGFILSIGMAVDANILIFERIKEERRKGKNFAIARELGFREAFASIKDANICTLIICSILFNPFSWGFLNTSGMVRGFAFTLGLGVLISLFTGVVVTRTFVRIFYRNKE